MLYSKEELPFGSNDIPTGKKIARWNCLSEFARYIPEYDENIPFGLLIGGYCVKVLELCQVEPRQGDGPYAMPCGHISGKTEGGLRCNFVKTSSNTLPTNNAIDHAIESCLKMMYDTEFTENKSGKRSLSHNDKRFLQMMED